MTGPNSLSFELFVLVVVRVLRIGADLAPVGVLTLLDAILLHHQLALFIRHLLAVRDDEDEDEDEDEDGDDGVDDDGDNDSDDVIEEHLLTVLLVDRVAHLARIRLTFFHCKSTTVSMCWLCWWNKNSKTEGINFSKITFDCISRLNLVHCGTPGWQQGDTLRERLSRSEAEPPSRSAAEEPCDTAPLAPSGTPPSARPRSAASAPRSSSGLAPAGTAPLARSHTSPSAHSGRQALAQICIFASEHPCTRSWSPKTPMIF